VKRLVCDTNVLVSGLLWRGALRRLLAGVETGVHTLFISRPLLDELNRVLQYPRLARALAAQPDVIVSGDRPLLTLGSFRHIPIISATRLER